MSNPDSSPLPYPPDQGQTHYPGCWITAGHHNCAVLEIYRLRRQLIEQAHRYEDELDVLRGRMHHLPSSTS